MHLRAMRHSTIQAVRHQSRRLARVAPPAIAVGPARAACLPVESWRAVSVLINDVLETLADPFDQPWMN